MNRPRNRQPRPPRQNQNQARGGGGQKPDRAGASRNNYYGSVPNAQQVVPGAGVWIVLKEDQPTGDETPGVVQDVLTRGNHPRGLKVRLRDGQVGRVQRMRDGAAGQQQQPQEQEQETGSQNSQLPPATSGATRFTHRYTDVRNDDYEYPSEPPARSLADFLPPEPEVDTGEGRSGEPAVTCPICEAFEGDETAVTHHIEHEHLS